MFIFLKKMFLTILNDPLSDNHRKLLHAFTGYRHRFEQSPNFKALRWGLGNIQDSGVCDLCEIGAPVVSEFLDFQNENLFFVCIIDPISFGTE